MRISETLLDAFNTQITIEFQAAHFYMAAAAELDACALGALGELMWRQAEEERRHAVKIVKYVLRIGATPKFASIDAITLKSGTVEALLELALQNEEAVTKSIGSIAALADKENDFASRGFIQWFVDEQMEELEKFEALVALAKLAGNNLLLLEERVRNILSQNTKSSNV